MVMVSLHSNKNPNEDRDQGTQLRLRSLSEKASAKEIPIVILSFKHVLVRLCAMVVQEVAWFLLRVMRHKTKAEPLGMSVGEILE